MDFKEKRKLITKKIVETMNILDTTKYNGKKYEELFTKMTDDEFKKYMNEFLNDEDRHFYLEMEPFSQSEPDLTKIKKAADYLKIPLDEYVYLPFENPKGEPIRTPYKVPVGYIQVKRLRAKRFLEISYLNVA